MSSYEEFRGTGGSLYYLRRQDILTGSDRVRIEIRDRASGLVSGVVNLTPGIDYNIDYLQGRILLSEPLSSTARDDLLIRGTSLPGDEAYLVVRYEYTPGFDQLDALSVGAQGHYWFGEHVKLGLTANNNDQGDTNSSIDGADITVRMSSESWFKLQDARTEGLITSTYRSTDGGFGFSGYDDAFFQSVQEAGGYRADVSVGLNDVFARTQGRVTLYKQELDAGYSAPGFLSPSALENYGGTFRMPVTPKLSLNAKADRRVAEQGLETRGQEIDVLYRLNERWGVSTGVRDDLRIDRSPVVPLTQEQGDRKDAVVQAEYDSKGRWSAYGFVQDTLSVTGDREENGRVGTGGSYRFSQKLRVNAEVSDGDLGTGGSLGTRYMPNERTTVYMNYALENESAEAVLQPGAAGVGGGNLTTGVKTRLSDSTSVYLEERYRSASYMSGLTHSTGVNLVPTQRLSFQREHGHRHPHGHADRRRDEAPSGRVQRRLRPGRPPGLERCRIPHGRRRAARSVVRDAATRGCSGATSSTSSAKRRAWSASSTIRTARARSGSSTTAATRKPFWATRSAPCATTGSTRCSSTPISTTCRRRTKSR